MFGMEINEFRLQKIDQELAALKNEEQTLVLEKQLLEDSEIHLKVEISCRDTVIEELETQLDQRDRAIASSSSSSHQTYDQILKQLFPVVLYRRKAQAARYCYAVGLRARILAGGNDRVALRDNFIGKGVRGGGVSG
ncbi:hypothetical protein Tcan_05106 [Toxocara canis]|uniref:Uncharacterized protein n=1 Tax=Toxocara canis TaxID=6265 RepID=A0A0B2W1Q1_TOXCA|nr:hypothetical protein Tcan_05106 [Toxocara canis]